MAIDAKFDVNENVSVLFDKLEKFLTSKTVIGEPIKVGEATLIPFISTSFGLGTGGGSCSDTRGGDQGTCVGSGMGAKISPTAVLVIKGDNIEMLPIKKSSSFEKLVEMVPEIVSKVNCCKKEDEIDKEE